MDFNRLSISDLKNRTERRVIGRKKDRIFFRAFEPEKVIKDEG